MTRRTGNTHHRARYSDETVERARQLADDGHGPRVIAQIIGVPRHTVVDWIYYRTRTGATSYRTLRRREKKEAA